VPPAELAERDGDVTLRTLVREGPSDTIGLLLTVYNAVDDDEIYTKGPTVRRALYGLARAGLVARRGMRRTRTGSYTNVWIVTGDGETLVEGWERYGPKVEE
jgi:transcription initiation factor IIE alpha subunit